MRSSRGLHVRDSQTVWSLCSRRNSLSQQWYAIWTSPHSQQVSCLGRSAQRRHEWLYHYRIRSILLSPNAQRRRRKSGLISYMQKPCTFIKNWVKSSHNLEKCESMASFSGPSDMFRVYCCEPLQTSSQLLFTLYYTFGVLKNGVVSISYNAPGTVVFLFYPRDVTGTLQEGIQWRKLPSILWSVFKLCFILSSLFLTENKQ